jgi:glycosyltransferase involved in cell wall biosynthesis
MRVAVLAEVFLPKIDGVVHRTVNLVRELQGFGDDVLVVCPEAKGCDDCSAQVAPFRSFAFPLYPEYRVGLPDRRLAKVIREFNPDVLHYVNPLAFGFRCHDVLHRHGVRVPSVFSFHTIYGEFVKGYPLLRPLGKIVWWLMKEYHNRADVNLTVSSIMQQELSERGFHRVRFWPPAVDGRLYQPGAKRSEMRARLSRGRPDRKLLVTVSRLAPEKSVGFLAGVLDRVPGATLAVIGDGPQRAELEQVFAGKDAHFVGYLKGADLAAAYASSDAFVYASETETMGNVVLEAMACGCPVVAPRAGGIPSLVSHGETGMLYTPGDVEEASRYTREVLGGTTGPRLAAAARAWVAGRDWTNSIAQVREAYREAIALHEPRRARRTYRHRLPGAVVSARVASFRKLARPEKGLRRDRAGAGIPSPRQARRRTGHGTGQPA